MKTMGIVKYDYSINFLSKNTAFFYTVMKVFHFNYENNSRIYFYFCCFVIRLYRNQSRHIYLNSLTILGREVIYFY